MPSPPHPSWPEDFWTNPFDSEYCRAGASGSVPAGEARVQGLLTDDPGSSLGVASQIAEIRIEVFKGTELYMGPSLNCPDPDAHCPFLDPSGRFGPKASYGIDLKINDFEANNLPGDPKYKVVVTATDAWGNSVTRSSPDITVYPY
jgi:hypothetical protein